MARKVFQDFANVLCQRFVEVPSNRDLVSMFLFGGGQLVLDLIARRATCNRYPVEPLPYVEDARSWIESQMAARNIPAEQLVAASLSVDYQIIGIRRTRGDPVPTVEFDFVCTGSIASPDRVYTSELKTIKTWGLTHTY